MLPGKTQHLIAFVRTRSEMQPAACKRRAGDLRRFGEPLEDAGGGQCGNFELSEASIVLGSLFWRGRSPREVRIVADAEDERMHACLIGFAGAP
ncbi:hypothetical protein M527_15485 [Sphingobium indicum IP26]|uniref:Uncharacterized protein n=1 Tax=Sphingobium indicum F2 TaxID=1450518 RepID=A0A8E1C1J0_9SPHN|nr:hypothetical protein M527_15485 [Sphingobium indicum IP26]KER35255.1 hypothetical protein AL00_16855 [Sphingobium indicum F2]